MNQSNKKIGLIGYLGYATDQPIIGGQMSKTRGIYTELIKKYGDDSIVAVDTSNWKKEKFHLLFCMLKVAIKCKSIIIMPNKNGIKIILPLFSLLKKIFKYSLAYPVVGGWLTSLLESNKYLAQAIKSVDYILPETSALANELTKYAICKIDIMPIFSTRTPINGDLVSKECCDVKKFCTFSRVIPEKGIDDAINAIVATNQKGIDCHLDIWGPIEEELFEHYKCLFDKYKKYITYRGVLSDSDGLELLSRYYMMLFPTYYPGEGFPTTVCESFMAALPVIASNWRFNNELVTEGETGFLVKVHDVDDIVNKIIYAINNTKLISEMKYKCILKSKEFIPSEVMKYIFNWLER